MVGAVPQRHPTAFHAGAAGTLQHERIADELGLPHRTALHYFNQLAQNNRIRKKKTGKRTVIWIRMEER